MKERSYEETREATNQAKIAALKEVLPITDNYFRARQVFLSSSSSSSSSSSVSAADGSVIDEETRKKNEESEQRLLRVYDNIFESFSKVIESFGVTRVRSFRHCSLFF